MLYLCVWKRLCTLVSRSRLSAASRSRCFASAHPGAFVASTFAPALILLHRRLALTLYRCAHPWPCRLTTVEHAHCRAHPRPRTLACTPVPSRSRIPVATSWAHCSHRLACPQLHLHFTPSRMPAASRPRLSRAHHHLTRT